MEHHSYAIKQAKRYLKIEKIKNRLYHLEDLHLIVQLVSPQRKSVNKFKVLLNKTHFPEKQKKLILEMAHSLTVINEYYRDEDTYGRLYVTREDMINSIYLLQNELELKNQEQLFRPNLRWFYKMIQLHFTDKTFTRKQASQTLNLSKTQTYRQLNELVDRNMILITGKIKQTFWYKIEKVN